MWAQANAGTSGYPTKRAAGLEPGPCAISLLLPTINKCPANQDRLAYALGLSMKFSYVYQRQREFCLFH